MMRTYFTEGQPREQLRLTRALKTSARSQSNGDAKITGIMPGRGMTGAEGLTASETQKPLISISTFYCSIWGYLFGYRWNESLSPSQTPCQQGEKYLETALAQQWLSLDEARRVGPYSKGWVSPQKQKKWENDHVTCTHAERESKQLGESPTRN